MKRKIPATTRDVKHPEETLPWWIPYSIIDNLRKERHAIQRTG